MTLQPGQRLRLLSMPEDPDPIPVGATCTVVQHVNLGSDLEQVWVRWEAPHERRTLNLIPGVDQWEVLP